MLSPPLSPIEARILGSLIEKAAITPDSYPLSLASLVAACNQATSREPVMTLAEDAVLEGVVALRRRGLVRAIQPAGSRVTKYQHLLDEKLDLDASAIAVLGVLMLRGEQTVAEVFSRTARLFPFEDHAGVEATLDALAARTPEALVLHLPRRPGQKEQRYMHLMAGDPHIVREPIPDPSPTSELPAPGTPLEKVVQELQADLAALRAEFEAFRRQFG